MNSASSRIAYCTSFLALFIVSALTEWTGAEEKGSAALFVVDTSAEFASTGGECVVYSRDSKPGPNRSLLGIVKGEVKSVVVIAAFEAGKDKLSQGLKPMVVDQSKDAPALRFPSSDLTVRWTFERPLQSDLFVAIYAADDPILVTVRKTIESIRTGSKPEVIALHSATLRNHFASLARNRTTDVDARIAPTSIAAVRRGLKTLHDEWKNEGLPIVYSKGKPGILVFKIAE